MSFPHAEAERVLNELQIISKDDLLLLDEIAWRRGVLVRYARLEGAEARLVINRRRGIVTISTAIKDQRRRRFGIAHELGHFEMHRTQRTFSLCIREDIKEGVNQLRGTDLEQEANIFASALLLPERFFAPLCQEEPTWNYLSQLSNDFDVSLTATALRYLAFCSEPIALVFSQGSRIKWFQGSKDFGEIREELRFFVPVGSQLDKDSMAGRLFAGVPTPVKKRRTLASAWFTSGVYRSDATILEQSISMPNYDAVLTLLWIDELIDEDDDTLW